MGIDFVERFFKLTLDNVYRFLCSLLFAVAIFGVHKSISPVAGLAQLLEWLAIPFTWLVDVGEWVTDRQGAVSIAAALTLAIAILAATSDWRISRSGSTALLSMVILIQTGRGAQMLITFAFVLAAFAVVTSASTLVARRNGSSIPGWVATSWEKVLNVAITLFLAATYIFSPLGWLISQESHNPRGTRGNPFYIDRVEQPMPTGALPVRSRPSN